jgi:uncharacterized membrane protein
MPKFLFAYCFSMTSMMWSQSSQQEKLEQRKAEIQREIRENENVDKC